jgi:hypothetical protein
MSLPEPAVRSLLYVSCQRLFIKESETRVTQSLHFLVESPDKGTACFGKEVTNPCSRDFYVHLLQIKFDVVKLIIRAYLFHYSSFVSSPHFGKKHSITQLFPPPPYKPDLNFIKYHTHISI